MPVRLLAFLFVGLLVPQVTTAPPRPPEKTGRESISSLGLQVAALQTLYHLDASPAQLQELARLARGCASTARRGTGEGSANFRQTLKSLRDALLRKYDREAIDALIEQVDDLRESEEPDSDDDVEPTRAAWGQAGRALALFNARQVARFLTRSDDEVPDPGEYLREAIRDSRDLRGADLATHLNDSAAEFAWLVAGADLVRQGKVRDQSLALLKRARLLKESELDRALEALTGTTHPVDVMRHVSEHALAQLLANPQLPVALASRLKALEK